MSKQRIFTATTGLVILAAAGALANDEPAPERAARQTAPRTVVVAPVELAEHGRSHLFHAVTRADAHGTLAFTVGGRVLDRPVQAGDRVEAGQLLARVDGRAYDNSIAATRGSLAQMDARLLQLGRDGERARRLFDRGALAEGDLERTTTEERALTASRASTRAQLREARRARSETTLRAPFAGVVTAVHIEAGELASAGAPIITLVGDGELELELEVPESIVSGVRVDTLVDVALPLAGLDDVQGRVRSVASRAAGPGRLFPVIVALSPSPGLVAGMAARARLSVARDPVPTVPVAAVVDPAGQRSVVFTVDDDGVTHEVEVEVEGLVGDRVAVTGPLTAASNVVVAGHAFLLDGDIVRVDGDTARVDR